MSATGLPPLFAAIVARARASAPFKNMCELLDAVPEKKTYPYAAIEQPFETPDDFFGQRGHSIAFVISIFTQDGATAKNGVGKSGYKAGLDIAEALISAIVDPHDGTAFVPLTVAGHDLVELNVVSVMGHREDDGITRRTEIQFDATLEDAQ